MALVGNRRRHQSLTVEVPIPSLASATRIHLTAATPPPAQPFIFSAASISDFEKLEVLGHGNDGTVYKVRHRRSSVLFALKILHQHHQSDPSIRRHICREIAAFHRAADSPSVIHCYSILASDSSTSPALLLEYMDSGSLESLLRRHGRLPEVAIREIAQQILLGLSYLHAQKVVHRDLKPSNLLVNSQGEIKISDFGVSRVMSRSLDPCDSFVGTCAYMSPERFDPETYGAKYDGYAADVWSLGLTVMELFLGRFPLLPQGQRPDWAALMCAICFGDPPCFPVDSCASSQLRDFVQCCVYKDPPKRWTVEQLLGHPFVTGGVGMDDESRAAFLHLIRQHPAATGS